MLLAPATPGRFSYEWREGFAFWVRATLSKHLLDFWIARHAILR
jgi:hypothetical protein